MATTTPRAASGVGVSAPTQQSATFSTYTAALREAGVGEDDLRLLRELAEMNAGDLAQPTGSLRPSRLLL